MMSRRRFLTSLGAVGTIGVATWLTRPWRTSTTTPPAAISGSTTGPAGQAPTSSTVAATTTSAPQTTTTTSAPQTTTATSAPLTTTTSPPQTTSTSAPQTTASPPETTTTSPPQTTTTQPGAALAVICKEAWGASPVTGQFRRHTIDRITVHHTAVVLGDNSAAPSRLRGHQEFHQSRGWPDIAYHFIIDAAGNVYEGRPVDAVGDTGTDYDPTGHFLVCCEGDFNQQSITAEQYGSLVAMLAWGAAEFAVDPRTIQGHRDVAATSCPGDDLYELLADGSIAADVAAAERRELRLVCGAEGEALVAAVEAG